MGFEEIPTKKEEGPLSLEEYYRKARNKAESIMKEIDKDIRVEVDNVIVTPDDKNKDEYRTLALRFKHISNPSLTWTMEIKQSGNYLENEFRNAVIKIYEDRKSEVE